MKSFSRGKHFDKNSIRSPYQAAYYCKSLDGFEYALNALLRSHGYCEIPFSDCLSFRCFAFRCKGPFTEWFSPFVTWQEAIRNLARYTGLGAPFHSEPLENARLENILSREWIMIGELAPGVVSESRIRDRFYLGLRDFILCRKGSDNLIEICNPMGSPYLLMEETQFLHMIENRTGFVLTLSGEWRPVFEDPYLILRDGMLWRKRCSFTHEDFSSADMDGILIDNPEDQISLRYGLLNYRMQMSKIARYCLQYMTERSAELNRMCELMIEISRSCESLDLISLQKMDHLVWLTFCEMAGESNV